MSRRHPWIKRYPHDAIHDLLIDRAGCLRNVPPDRQAGGCPYYVPLKGTLGADWGVIVNPESPKFGKLVFEHDYCGCAEAHEESRWHWTGDVWREKES